MSTGLDVQQTGRRNRKRRCQLVWTRGVLLDMDPESREVVNWWRPENIRAFWCSELHPTRILISENSHHFTCDKSVTTKNVSSSSTGNAAKDAFVTEPTIRPSFAVYDCLQRDALLASVTGSAAGSGVPILVGPGHNSRREAEAFFLSHIISPNTSGTSCEMSPQMQQLTQGHSQQNRRGSRPSSPSADAGSPSSSMSLIEQERTAAVNVMTKQLGTAVPPGTSNAMLGAMGGENKADQHNVLFAARGLCAT